MFWVRLPLCCRHWGSRIRLRETKRLLARGERASKRTAATSNTVEWNGTERNGTSVTKYQLSPYQRAAALHKPRRLEYDSRVRAIATYFVALLVLDARCHRRRHRRPWRYPRGSLFMSLIYIFASSIVIKEIVIIVFDRDCPRSFSLFSEIMEQSNHCYSTAGFPSSSRS